MKHKIYAPMPHSIKECIGKQKNLTSTEVNQTLRLTQYVLNKATLHGIPHGEYVEISREHFRHRIGTQYNKPLRRLEHLGILEVDHNYIYYPDSKRKGVCKRYLIPSYWFDSEPVLVEYTESKKKQFDNDFITRKTVSYLSRLSLDLRKKEIVPYVKGLVTFNYIKDQCKFGEDIPNGNYRYQYVNENRTSKRSKNPCSKEWLLARTEEANAVLVLYKGVCYISTVEANRFIWRKVQGLRQRYIADLVKLRQIRVRQSINCKRNNTNYRLDTNLTNLKSSFINLIKLDGEKLVGIDLKNSQLTLFCSLLQDCLEYANYLHIKQFKDVKTFEPLVAAKQVNKVITKGIKREAQGEVINRRYQTLYTLSVTKFVQKKDQKYGVKYSLSDDCELFCSLSKNGILYEEFAKMVEADGLGQMTRAEAKTAIFETIFSSRNNNTPLKRLLKNYFPTVVAIIDGFKERMTGFYLDDMLKEQANKEGNRSLALLLQTYESEIFIDKILYRLLKEGFRLFTKHDSVLCKESDLPLVHKIICEELDRLIGKNNYQLKIEQTH